MARVDLGRKALAGLKGLLLRLPMLRRHQKRKIANCFGMNDFFTKIAAGGFKPSNGAPRQF